jgi:hypothetical protein
MAFHIHCPNGHVLEIEDSYLGRKVRCPHCQVVMVPQAPPGTDDVVMAVSASPQPLPTASPAPLRVLDFVDDEPPARRRVEEEDLPPRRRRRVEDEEDSYEEEEPRRRKSGKMKKATRMRLARWGLAFHAAKIVCLLLAILVIVIGVVLGLIAVGAGSSGLLVVYIVCVFSAGLLWALAPFLGTVGSLLCLWVPQKTGGKTVILISFTLDALGAVTYLGCILINVLTGAFAANSASSGNAGSMAAVETLGVLGVIGILASAVMFFVGWILFMLFLRAMLLYFRESGFAHDCLTTLILCIGMGVFTPFYFVGGIILLAVLAHSTHPALGGLCSLLMIIVWIVVWVNLLIKILNQIVVVRGHLSAWT